MSEIWHFEVSICDRYAILFNDPQNLKLLTKISGVWLSQVVDLEKISKIKKNFTQFGVNLKKIWYFKVSLYERSI